ncbi:hypothetical protein [Hoeflea sp.]|uniref:hypothetical protein n=1 Tax=Hoeflea sp. TaxID=1940281 RepID=UPI003BAF28BC
MLVLQTLFFMAIAFVAGCFFGCWLKRRIDSGTVELSPAKTVSHAAKPGEAAATPASSPSAGPSSSAPAEPSGSETAAKPDAAPPVAAAATAPVAKGQDSVQSEPAAPKEPKPAGKAAKSKSSAKKASAGTSSKKASPDKKAASAKSATSSKAKPAATKAKAVSGTKPAAAAGPDNLKKIKGVGPQLEAKLNAIGVTSFAQIAKWTRKQQAEFSEQLSFPGRIERDDWVAQAKVLAKGGDTEFSKRVAKGDVASSKGAASGTGKSGS